MAGHEHQWASPAKGRVNKHWSHCFSNPSFDRLGMWSGWTTPRSRDSCFTLAELWLPFRRNQVRPHLDLKHYLKSTHIPWLLTGWYNAVQCHTVSVTLLSFQESSVESSSYLVGTLNPVNPKGLYKGCESCRNAANIRHHYYTGKSLEQDQPLHKKHIIKCSVTRKTHYSHK